MYLGEPGEGKLWNPNVTLFLDPALAGSCPPTAEGLIRDRMSADATRSHCVRSQRYIYTLTGIFEGVCVDMENLFNHFVTKIDAFIVVVYCLQLRSAIFSVMYRKCVIHSRS